MVIFCLVQGIFLFGSAKLPGGLTQSEYARQGFFQLCAAAIFVFALVALCRTCTRQAEGGWKTALGALYTLLLLCTMVLICSSFYRLMLYEQVYSFTRLRIYVQAFSSCWRLSADTASQTSGCLPGRGLLRLCL